MGVIAWILLGLVVGLIAEKIMRSSHGPVITTLIGVAGASLGGWVNSRVFHIADLQGFFNLSRWITTLCGAVALLAVIDLTTGQRRGTGCAR